MSTPLLQIKNLSVAFNSGGKNTQAIQNIDITVNRGEIVAIVGESGSGKSVTSLSVLQLLPVPPAIYNNGEILFTTEEHTIDMLGIRGKDLQNIRGNKMSIIFQEPMTSLNPVLTCGAQVMEAILLHNTIARKEARQRTITLFSKVQLPDPALMFQRYPHQLSGGQKQRVMIAMAISCQPALLICDEPTTALDVTVQKNILLLIKELQQQNNMGVIFITHDLGLVAEVADRVNVMYKGKIVEENTCEQLFRSPLHPYTKALLACRPSLHHQGERLPIVSDFMQVTATGEMVEQLNAIKATFLFNSNSQNTVNSAQLSIGNNLQAVVDNLYADGNNQPSTLLSVQNLKVYYPSRKTFFGKVISYTKAVDNVSFEVYEGETFGLVGESGCGKSTLGRSILRLIPATAGTIIYKGEDLLTAPNSRLKALRKEMQIIFQDPYSSLNPRIKIGDAIAEPLKVHNIVRSSGAAKARVIELLKKVDLNAEYYNRYPHEFSGGQRQRIAIARALALQPSFLICDECVSALDVSVQAQILNLLNDLKKEFRFTAIFISHDLAVVRYISDRIMVMQNGKIEEIGNAEKVYSHPQSEYTKRLIAAIPKINGQWARK
jgi:peptide/nickel transport system ATP-binding protein